MTPTRASRSWRWWRANNPTRLALRNRSRRLEASWDPGVAGDLFRLAAVLAGGLGFSSAFRHALAAIPVILARRRRGHVMDDFSTGFSGLSYLWDIRQPHRPKRQALDTGSGSLSNVRRTSPPGAWPDKFEDFALSLDRICLSLRRSDDANEVGRNFERALDAGHAAVASATAPRWRRDRRRTPFAGPITKRSRSPRQTLPCRC